MSDLTAQVWRFHGFDLDSLQLQRFQLREPAANEIRVSVAAVALNYRDLLVHDGSLLGELPRPYIPASDAVGYVEAVGEKVSRFRVGDRVLGQFWVDWRDELQRSPNLLNARSLGAPLPGMLADHVLLHEEHAVHAPYSLSDREAATLPIAGLTAFSALIDQNPIEQQQTVLVQGTGGVATFAIQLAAAVGARVIATSGSDVKLDRARSLGAAQVINRSNTPHWADQVLALTEGRGVDRIVELAGGSSLAQSLSALSFGGEIAQVGFLESPTASVELPSLMLRCAKLRGVAVGSRAAFERFVAWIDAHGLQPVLDSEFQFSAAREAFDRLSLGPVGKVVVSL